MLEIELTRQFVRFVIVGTIGFIINVAVVYLLRTSIGLYWAGAAAFVAAASTTWIGNRTWTFEDRSPSPAPRQWALYLGFNLLSLGLYCFVYGVLVALVPLCRVFPVLPVGAGSIVGLFANFSLSRRVVFR